MNKIPTTTKTTECFILDGYAAEDEFADANRIHRRTIARYRNLPDGLPYVVWGGSIYIHVASARKWLLENHTRQRNATPPPPIGWRREASA